MKKLNFEETVRFFDMEGKIVRHFKGNKYLVLGKGENTETGETMVIYKALYDTAKIWIRPAKMFLEKVPVGKENPTGQEYRFEKINIESEVQEWK